jgi:hypothetical protein
VKKGRLRVLFGDVVFRSSSGSWAGQGDRLGKDREIGRRHDIAEPNKVCFESFCYPMKDII